MKKNSAKMKLLSAAGMLGISAAMLATSTYAWFTMNKTVTATGMQVKAKAESGLLISNAAQGTYADTATTTKTTCTELYPGSTKDLTNWLHSTSKKSDTANTEEKYDAGVEWTENNGDYGNYVSHDFYIKSSSEEFDVTSLDINSVTVKVGSNAPAQDLSKSIRVGLKIEGDSANYFYAPVEGFTTTVSVQNAAGDYSSSERTNVTAVAGDTKSNSSITKIPSVNGTPIHATVYIWFEGEDNACISDNLNKGIPNLEQLDFTVEFGYTETA